MSKIKYQREVLEAICSRAHYLTTQMIYMANHRSDKEKGDPKVGGHPAACASSLHIMGALHLVVKSGYDHVANKPHAAPGDHAYNYLLDLFLKPDLSRLSIAEANEAMSNLRSFSKNGEYVFQSYHSAYDSDHHNFFPSGTVGIPPVNAGYLAHAYTFCREHGYEVPEAHFWSILGDSEFREGSVFECVPDFAEREIGNLTWIVDYNRQSLDGHRITNKDIMNGTDDKRIERTLAANGWEVIQVRHGKKREALFAKSGGDAFKKWIEDELQDYELQALLLVKDAQQLKDFIIQKHDHLKKFVQAQEAKTIQDAIHDFGGHDIIALIEAMEKSKLSKRKPSIIIAHTIKGWGLQSAAQAGNHSSLPEHEEILALQKKQGLKPEELFARFESSGVQGQYCTERGRQLHEEIKKESELRERNVLKFQKRLQETGEIPTSFGINLKMASYPHTQWMLGQCTAKLTRIANTNEKEKPLSNEEKPWRLPGELLVSMAPDVGTSTNLNPAMDGKIFGANILPDYETDFGVKDHKTPDLVPGEDNSDRFIRFEIAEGNVMSCVGSYGKVRDFLGIPIIPLMTVYDFFVKRAHDQFFYNLYWKSNFILVGTPSGVTLSPEGAQHGWKSDFQIPNQITWEPFYCIELDWILAESIRLHLTYQNQERNGVFIRGVTKGIEQKQMLALLKEHKSNAQLSDEEILEKTRVDALRGAYYLIDYRGYEAYEPGDNVAHIFAMGALGSEAILASQELLKRGIYANVIIVTSSDLLVGNLGYQNNFEHLQVNLGIDSKLFIHKDIHTSHETGFQQVSGRRIPVVSVHDGEPGLLDNIGSIIGVRHEALCVRKHSRCGRPEDIYKYHHMDSHSIVEACGKVLSETALESIELSQNLLRQLQGLEAPAPQHWRSLWPELKS